MNGPHAPSGVTARALKRTVFKPITWVVADLIPEGLTVFAGKPKLGKSWLMLQTAFAVSTGGYILDQKVAQGDVLYCALEDSERRLQARMAKVSPRRAIRSARRRERFDGPDRRCGHSSDARARIECESAWKIDPHLKEIGVEK